MRGALVVLWIMAGLMEIPQTVAVSSSHLRLAPVEQVPTTPQGTVAKHSFQSTAIGGPEEFYVYTPAGYDAKRKEPYPVLYLLHGVQGDAHSWITDGGANTTLDRLIAERKAKPMILVMPLSFGTPDGRMKLPNFSRALLDEIIPRVGAAYHTSPDRMDRAIAGLSMGGGEALVIGLNNIDRFAWIGGFSPATAVLKNGPTAPWNVPALGGAVNARIKLLYLTCGTADSLITDVRQFRDFLTRGVSVRFVETPDAGHVWSLWSRNLADMAQLVFQESGK